MSKTILKVVRGALVGALVLFLLPAAAGAVQHEVRIYLDLDDDTATGCEVTTVDGVFSGAEQVLITTVETSSPPDAGTITDAALAECTDEVTDTFGIPTSFDGNWPVGVGNGEGGRDVVETYAPLLALVIQDPSVVRLGVVVTDEQGGEEALLTVDDTPDGPAILLDLRSVLEIPTLGEWGLILLALLLAAASVHLMGRRGTAAVGVALLVLATGVAWAAGTLDGLTDDWSPADLLASNGLVLFGKGAPDQLCFRVDVDLLFNQPPTITDIADQTIPEDGTTGALAFTVGDPESPATTLTVTATSSNQVLVPDGNLALGGSGANRTITVTPAADQNGMTDVTVTVEDPDGGTASTTFRVTVTSENDPPTITAIADQTIDEDTSTGPLAFTVGDVETAPGSLSVTASSDDQTIIPDGNLVLDGSGANRTITVTPAADQNGGPVTVTVTVQDSDGGSVPEQFDVTVTPVNDPPTITAIADQTIDEDTSTGPLAFTIDDVDDPVGSLTVGATSSDQTLIPDGNLVIGGAAPNLTIEATPAANENGGPATITVTVTDPSAAPASETFDVTVTPVNDPPAVANATISYAALGNTLLRVPGNDPDHDAGVPGRIASTSDPDDAFVKAAPSDIDSASVGFQAGTFPTTNSGSLTIDGDGDFHYTPPTGVTAVTDDVTVQVEDTEGLTTPVTIEITLAGLVWYVEDTTDATKNPAGGPGTSRDAFETLGAAETASGPGDFILVFETDAPLDEGITLKSGQKLYGQPVEDEATPLLPGGLLLEEIDDTGARPVISPDPDTDAVSVAATGGSLVDVEIRHLELSGAGSGNPIDVTSTDPHAVGVTIADNRIDESEKEGIDLNPGSSGDFTATVENNTFSTFSPSGNAIDVTTAAGNSAAVEVAIDGNTDVTSRFDTAIHLDGSQGTGTVFVTSFADNTVHGNTDGAGVMATDVTFDADPSTGAFDEVAAGTWSVGENGNAVGAAGMYLGTTAQEVEGHLSFTQLDVFAGGAGLDVSGAGLFTAGPPDSGFQLTIAGGTIEANGGPGVTIDPATLGITLDSVTSTSSTTGISLADVAGTFSATGGSIATTGAGSGPTFRVSGGSVSASYGGAVASAVGNSVQVQNMTGGSVTLNGPVDDDGAGISITGNAAATSVAFNGGLDLVTETDTAFTATGDGSVTVASAPTNTISTTTGTGVLVNGVDTGVDFDFDTVTVSNGGAAGISIQSSTGTKTFGTVSITNSGGAGLFASNAGTVNVTNAASSIATTGQPAVDADNTAFGATFASLTSSGSATTGIDLASVGGSFTATSVTIDGTTGAGVQLTGIPGVVALNGGTIGATATTTGNAVDVDGGAAGVTIAAAITNSTARSVEVTNRSGGTVTISGAIDDTGTGIHVASNTGGTTTFNNASKVLNTGANPAVNLTTNGGHTVNFTNGGLDIDTTSGAGFSATVSGTVNVTGSANTVNTTTGTAVNIADTTIGTDGVTIRNITTTSASSNTAIILDDTGSGAFEVSGTGSAGSGGTLDNKTADAVQLDNTDGPVTLRHMIIEDIGNMAVEDSEHDAIHGQDVDGGLVLDGITIRRISDMAVHGAVLPSGDGGTVWNGLTITNSTIRDTNRYQVAGEGDTSDEGSVRIVGLRGTVLVDGNTFQNGAEHLDLFATAGDLGLTVTSNQFLESYKEFASGPIASVGKMCVDLTVQGAANATAVIGDLANAALGNNFRNCRLASVRIANDAGATGTINATTARNSFVVNDHSSGGDSGDFDFPMGGVKYSTRGTNAAVFNGIVSGNTFDEVTNADGGLGQVTLDIDGGQTQFRIDNNTFDSPGNAPWFIRSDNAGNVGAMSMKVLLQSNSYVRGFIECPDPSCDDLDSDKPPVGVKGFYGPGLRSLAQVQNGADLDITIDNDDFAKHDVSFDAGNTVEVQVLNVGGGGTVCAFFTNNSSPHGYALEESAGDLDLAKGASATGSVSCTTNPGNGPCVTVLDDNGNTGGDDSTCSPRTLCGDPAADPPDVDVFGTIDLVAGTCPLPSGGIF